MPNKDSYRIRKQDNLFYVLDSKGNKKGSYQTAKQAQAALNRMTTLNRVAANKRWYQ